MNVRLLRRIQREILKEPRRFDMDNYFDMNALQARCGTSACIAGWALVLKRHPGKPITETNFPKLARMAQRGVDRLSYGRNAVLEERGIKALGITEEQAERLFYHAGWPQPFERLYSLAAGLHLYQDAAEVACERIEHFIETNGEE